VVITAASENLSNARLANPETAQLNAPSMSILKSKHNAAVGDSRSRKMNWAFYGAFIVATVAVTKFFTSHKYFTLGDSTMGYIVVCVSVFFLIASCVFMAFDIYVEEKEKDNLQVNFPLFEYLYKRFKAN
jgi:hypothetical protein